jgi:hypothetical protein
MKPKRAREGGRKKMGERRKEGRQNLHEGGKMEYQKTREGT